MRVALRLLRAAAIVLALAAPSSNHVQAQSSAPPGNQLDPQRLASWVDGYFGRTMARTRVPGAVVVVVDHGRVVLMRGYGTVTPGGRPMDPERTLLRIGSISKVFAAITASEMIEERAINPNLDVNTYLRRIQVPARFDRPITVNDLLLHESGMASDLRGMDAPTDREAQVAPSEMQRLLTPRIRPPGVYPAYDNNGWGLLGVVLADASHMSYRELIARRIFGPLGMSRSVVGLPDSRRAEAANDHHVLQDGTVERIPWSLLKPIEQSAGDISSTGSDMARFMIAMLQGGQLEGHQVIPATVHASITNVGAHRLHPSLDGYGRAMYEDRPAGRFAWRHDGGMSGSAASMVLYPEAQVGVFFAINARPPNPFDAETFSGLLRGISIYLNADTAAVPFEEFLKYLKFHEAFAAAFLPPRQWPPAAPSILWSQEQLASLAGTYVATNSQYAGFIGNLQVGLVEGRPVSVDGNGLRIGADRYRQVAAGLFENETTHVRLAFVREGNETFLSDSWLWRQRLRSRWENPLLVVFPLALLPLLLITGLVYIRRASPRRNLGICAAGLGLAYLAGWLLEAEFAVPLFIADHMLIVLLWRIMLLASIVGLLGWPVFAARNWLAKRPAGKVRVAFVTGHFALLTLAAWWLVALALYWNLVWPTQ